MSHWWPLRWSLYRKATRVSAFQFTVGWQRIMIDKLMTRTRSDEAQGVQQSSCSEAVCPLVMSVCHGQESAKSVLGHCHRLLDKKYGGNNTAYLAAYSGLRRFWGGGNMIDLLNLNSLVFKLRDNLGLRAHAKWRERITVRRKIVQNLTLDNYLLYHLYGYHDKSC
jgi:hypothetical protein